MATQTATEEEDLSTIRFVSARDRKEIFTLPPLEREVMHKGRAIVDRKTFPQIVIEPGQGHRPRSQLELRALRESDMNVANGGRVFKEVDVSGTPEVTGENTDLQEADTSDSDGEVNTEPQTESATGPVETVTSKTEAAEVLMDEPYNVPRQALLTENENLSVTEIRDVAEEFGVSFPNL